MTARRVEILRPACNFIAALALMSLLFAALPGLRSVKPPAPADTVTLPIDRSALPEMKKEVTRQRRAPAQMLRSVQTHTRGATDRIVDESFKFAPDLGVQGSGDIAVEDRHRMKAQIFNEDETDVRPVLAVRTPIVYPPGAQQKEIEGVADLEILVDEAGKVVRINFNQLPSELFRAPVINAVMQWRFKPAQVKGVAVSVRVRQKITFRLSQTSD